MVAPTPVMPYTLCLKGKVLLLERKHFSSASATFELVPSVPPGQREARCAHHAEPFHPEDSRSDPRGATQARAGQARGRAFSAARRRDGRHHRRGRGRKTNRQVGQRYTPIECERFRTAPKPSQSDQTPSTSSCCKKSATRPIAPMTAGREGLSGILTSTSSGQTVFHDETPDVMT